MKRNRDGLREKIAGRMTIVLFEDDVKRLAAIRLALTALDTRGGFIGRSEAVRWAIQVAAEQLTGGESGL